MFVTVHGDGEEYQGVMGRNWTASVTTVPVVPALLTTTMAS